MRAYHGELEKLKLKPYRALKEDLELTTTATSYAGTSHRSVADGSRKTASGGEDRCRFPKPTEATNDFKNDDARAESRDRAAAHQAGPRSKFQRKQRVMMLIAERQSRLRELLARRGMCDLIRSPPSCGSRSRPSAATSSLVDEGLVQRTHGGVIWVGDRSNAATPGPTRSTSGWATSSTPSARSPRRPRSLVQPGETILIDGGTTTFYLAEELLGRPLQLVTNSLPIANLFLNDENVELVLTGGLMYPRYGVLLGPGAESSSPPSTPRRCSSASPASTTARSTTRTCCSCRPSGR